MNVKSLREPFHTENIGRPTSQPVINHFLREIHGPWVIKWSKKSDYIYINVFKTHRSTILFPSSPGFRLGVPHEVIHRGTQETVLVRSVPLSYEQDLYTKCTNHQLQCTGILNRTHHPPHPAIRQFNRAAKVRIKAEVPNWSGQFSSNWLAWWTKASKISRILAWLPHLLSKIHKFDCIVSFNLRLLRNDEFSLDSFRWMGNNGKYNKFMIFHGLFFSGPFWLILAPVHGEVFFWAEAQRSDTKSPHLPLGWWHCKSPLCPARTSLAWHEDFCFHPCFSKREMHESKK